jgi:hypothetical protein
MSKTVRPHKKAVRLSDAELWYTDQLCELDGVSSSALMRRGILKEARERGLVYPGPESVKKKKPPKH